MCKSKTPRFSAHLLHLTLFSKFVSKKRENFAISEDFSEYRRKKLLIAANHFYMLYRFRRELIEELQSRYEVIVAAPFQTGEEVFESMGIRCTETKMQRRRVQVLSELRLLQAYKRVLCLEKPDLVLTYAIKPNVYMGFLCTCYRIPFYATVQGLGSAFQRPWLSCVATFLYKLSFLRVQNVFFENQSNAVEFCRRHILPPEKEVVLHGAGVDLNRYIYTPYTAHDPPRFLFVGRLMREKGVEELFCAVRRLWTEGFHVHLQLLGFFEEQYRQEVDRLIAGGMTEFFGFQKEPLPFYQNCDCVVLPSYHEGMSNVLLEAAAVGRPIIASDIPGCREAVEHSKTGLLCRAKDADSLYVAMRAFLALSTEQKAALGQNGRRKMEREFDKASVVAETLRIVTAEKAAPQPRRVTA